MNWNNWLYADRLGEEKQTPKPQTNADRIRAMSDEELADWLAYYVIETFDYNGIQHDGLESGERERILRSLKQPAEGEQHEQKP